MTAVESGIEDAGGRPEAAARGMRGLMAIGAGAIVLAAVHYAFATVADMDDPNEGNPWDLQAWEWAMLAAPIVLPVAVAAWLIVAGVKRLKGLRAGEQRAQRAVNSLAYVSAAGSGLYAAYVFWTFGFGESGFGPSTSSPGRFFESLGDLNAIGWMGTVGFVGLVVLFFGALVVAALTRPSRT